MGNQLMIIKQLPIIEEKFKNLGVQIDAKVKDALSLVATEENRQKLKDTRAELKKEYTDYEDQRKVIKEKVMQPYNQFEGSYKTHIGDKFKTADAELKKKIDDLENVLKQKKEDDARKYFDEYAESTGVDFVQFENVGLKIGLSNTLASLKKQIKATLDQVVNDLELIDTQEYKTEILVAYKKSLNVSLAITTVNNRMKAIEEEKIKQAAAEAAKAAEEKNVTKVEAIIEETKASIAPPTEEAQEDEIKVLSFKVTAPVSKLRKLKRFLEEGGYKYE